MFDEGGDDQMSFRQSALYSYYSSDFLLFWIGHFSSSCKLIKQISMWGFEFKSARSVGAILDVALARMEWSASRHLCISHNHALLVLLCRPCLLFSFSDQIGIWGLRIFLDGKSVAFYKL